MALTNPVKGTIGYDAAIDRPDRSKRPTYRTDKHPTRQAAICACLDAAFNATPIKVRDGDKIVTHEWTATGTGGWQVEMMRILSAAESVTVKDALMKWPGFATPATV